MRILILIVFLAGCTPPAVDTMYRPNGEPIDIAYIVMAPFCVMFCNTQVTSTGSQSNVRGDGASTVTQSPTASLSQGGKQ